MSSFLVNVPDLVLNLMAILFGLIFGSFTTVLVARLPKRESLWSPGSHCTGCGHQIRWYENIPVFSYLALRGKCSGCGKAISIRYPVIELLTALLFLATSIRFGWSFLLILRDWPMMVLFVAIAFIDLEHRIIPDRLSIPGLVLGLVGSFFDPSLGIVSALSGAVLGFAFFWAMAWFYEKQTGQAGMGGGDIKLLAMLGAYVGPMGVLYTVFVSSIFGSVAGFFWSRQQKNKDLMKTSIPYGPFLIVGALAYCLISGLIRVDL